MNPLFHWFVTGALPFVVLLGLLIFVHESGHFALAKLSRMRVDEFSLGFGPPLFRVVRNGTGYAIRMIPLGGFVKIAGMDPNEDPDTPGGFNTKPLSARFMTLLAGCFMNFALAVALFCVVGMIYGVPRTTTRLDAVEPGSPAASAGIRQGDVITAIGGEPVPTVEAIRAAIEKAGTHPIRVTFRRGQQTITAIVTPKHMEPGQTVRIGVAFAPHMVRVGPGEALKDGLVSTIAWADEIGSGLVKMVTGHVPASDIGGPVAIARATAQQARRGMADFLRFGGIISIDLAIINLVPFPGLDGARLAFLLVELVRRRKLDPRKEAYVHAVGIAILFALLAAITGKDISQWIHDLGAR
jgi:regulator of sigma E protease